MFKLNDDMKYSYYVHDFTNGYSSSSTAMAASGAKVQVYAGNVCYFTFNVPNEGGTWWHVFDYDPATDALTPVNAMSYSNSFVVTYGKNGLQRLIFPDCFLKYNWREYA